MFSDPDITLAYKLGYVVGVGMLAWILWRRFSHGGRQFRLSDLLWSVASIALIAGVTAHWIRGIERVRRASEAVAQIGGTLFENHYLQYYDVYLDKPTIGDAELDAVVPYLAVLPEVDVVVIGSSITRTHAASVQHRQPNCNFIFRVVPVDSPSLP